MVVLVVISLCIVPVAFCQETEDSQVFIAGFNSYQQKDYASAIEKMNEVLTKYPDTPLRDMALFWLSRSYFKAGNQLDAARYLSQFTKEYPDNPLKGTIEEELLSLAARYDRGEKIPAGPLSVKDADRQAAEKKELERLAALKAEEERVVAEKARVAAAGIKEQERLAALKAEEERIALEKAAGEKAEQERVAALKKEEARKAAEKAEEDRVAAEKAEIARQAAESSRLALLEAEKESRERERLEQERLAGIKAEQDRLAAVKADEERKATTEKAEQELRTLAKAEEARQASLSAESARIAALKAEEERRIAEKEALDAETARLAAEKKKEQERLAALKAEEERSALEKARQEKAEQDRIAAVKAEEAARAAAAESARLAALKAEEDRRIAEKATLDAETARQAAARAEEQKLARQRIADEKIKAEKAALREKAIALYKSIIDKYPSSAAASSAAAKLRELGVAVSLPPAAATVETLPENAQILRLEVAQFAGFEFNLLTSPGTCKVAQRISVPFEITNRGNGNDSFYLESGFPEAFNSVFAAASSPDVAINQTPAMAPGEVFKGIVHLLIPATSIDGLRITHPVKAASRFMAEASQSREISLTASAPLLRAVLKTEKTRPVPGEKIVYRTAVLNVGSTVAQDVTFRINFPPQLEPVDYAAAGFKQEAKSALVLDGLQVNSGESKDFSVTFQLKEDSLAGQELSTRAELINNQLKTTTAFVSNMAYVQPQHGILVRSGTGRIMVIPGQTVTVPFIVTNTGNVHEKFRITSSVKGVLDAAIFHDVNRDGIRQANEPLVSEIGPLAPKEEVSIVMEIKTSRAADDSSEASALLSFSSEGESGRSASGLAQLVYSRPVLQMAMAGREGRLKPGEVSSFDLTITNKGSNLARVVELQSAWPEQLELVASDPSNSSFSNGNIVWRFKEMGAAEKRNIKVSFRVKPGIGVGTNIQLKNVMTYEDQLGNRY